MIYFPDDLLSNYIYESQAEQHPGWLVEARVGEHTPETVEYGISSITFRSRRPFNMQRFNELKTAMEKRHHLHGGATHDSEEKKEEDRKVAEKIERERIEMELKEAQRKEAERWDGG